MAEKSIKITSIQIKNFRSFRNETIKSSDLNILVGLNDAGKSNVLKALNLFFNKETDYNTPFSFSRDFTFLFPTSSHSTKEIKIELHLDIPDSYADFGEYTWTKTWRVDDYFQEEIKNDAGDEPNARSRIPGALRRIKYRYVPAVKSSDYYKTLLGEVYKSVSQSLNNTLKDSVSEFSSALNIYTEELSAEIKTKLNLSSVLSIPQDLNDIFRALIFETCASEDCIHVPLTARGDGIQACHIPIILRYISQVDQTSRNKGSMKVWTIWGYEEPENGLELLRTFSLADEFEQYSNDIQIFVSTHSPAFYMKKSSKNSQVFFVSKKIAGEESIITCEKSAQSIAENMGLMPLVAPFIEEQSKLLIKAEEIYKTNVLTDVPTIMVEGETDKEYLELAIKEHSMRLEKFLVEGQLRIIYKYDGGGTTTLTDWANAWIYSRFKSKLLILFDKDLAGIEAKKKIDESPENKAKMNSSNMRTRCIEPSDPIISIIQKHIEIHFEIEHLFSINFWKKMKQKGYAVKRDDKQLQQMFISLIPSDRTLQAVMEELIPDSAIRDTILCYEPMKTNKKKILSLLQQETDKKAATEGFVRTIQKIEEYFC